MILVDTNVLIDILSKDAKWFAWSLDALDRHGDDGPLLINEVVYAELSARMESEDEINAAVKELNVRFERSPQRALFLAGQAYRRYRRTGGTRTGTLPDLIIGAHAQVLGCPLITRDVRRYRTYFSDVELITPEG